MGELTYTVGGANNLTSFRTAARVPITNAKAYFKPTQDLHGYDKPWPAGGGKNLLNTENATPTGNSYTITEGAVTTSYVSGGNGSHQWFNQVFPAGTYTMSAKYSGSVSGVRFLCDKEITDWTWNNYYNGYFGPTDNTITFTTTETFSVGVVFLTLTDHTGETGTIYDIQFESGSTATSYAPYANVCPISGWTSAKMYKAGKNIGHVIGYSATTMVTPTHTRTLANSYGTTISTTDYSLPDTALVITQSQAPSTDSIASYKNGYICIGVDNLVYGQYYDISFKMSNIVSNPLGATTMQLQNPAGDRKAITIVENGYCIAKNLLFRTNSSLSSCYQIEIRNCGVSFTLSEFMVTPANTNDGVFEPYCGDIIPVTFPVVGKNVTEWVAPGGYTAGAYYNGNNGWHNGWVPPTSANGKKITYSATIDNSNSDKDAYLHVWTKDANNQYVDVSIISSIISPGTSSTRLSRTITINTNRYKTIYFGLTMGAGATASHPMVEYGDTATTYESYSSNNTVYGGYVDIAAGEAVATYGLLDIGTLNYTYRSNLGGGAFTATIAYNGAPYAKDNWTGVCTKYPYLGAYWNLNNVTQGIGYVYYKDLIVKDTNVTLDDADAIKTALNGTILCYELATPLHYPLSPTELTSFLDQNNIWSNTNDVTAVSYAMHDTAAIRMAKQRIVANEPHIETISSPIASFNTDLKAPIEQCKFAFKPIQDLHGYSNPWPAGGGKNLFDPNCDMWNHNAYTKNADGSITQTGSDGRGWTDSTFKSIHLSAGTYTISASDNKRFAYATSLDSYATTTSLNSGKNFTLAQDCDVKIKHSSSDGYPTTFTVQLEKGSTATTYAPYENICPISGWTKTNIWKAGNNLLNISSDNILYKNISTTPNASGNYYSMNGSDITIYNTNGNAIMVVFKVLEVTNSLIGKQVSLGYTATGDGDTGIMLADLDGNNRTTTKGSLYTILATDIGRAIGVRVRVNGFISTYTVSNIQVNFGSSPTTYTPYNGTTIPIEFPALGKNLLDSSSGNDVYYSTYNAYTVSDGVLTSTGATLMGFKCKCKPSTQYTFSFNTTYSSIGIRVISYAQEPTAITLQDNFIVNATGTSATFTTNANSEWLVCGLYIVGGAGNVTISQFQLETGSSATTYKPYTNTVYGGTIDLVNGTLQDDWFSINVNNVYKDRESQDIVVFWQGVSTQTKNSAFISNRFSNTIPSDTPGRMVYYNGALYFIVPKSELSTYDKAGCEEWLETHPTTVLMQRATPLTYSLTLTQLKSLIGTNNIWSSTNDNTTVSYWTH